MDADCLTASGSNTRFSPVLVLASLAVLPFRRAPPPNGDPGVELGSVDAASGRGSPVLGRRIEARTAAYRSSSSAPGVPTVMIVEAEDATDAGFVAPVPAALITAPRGPPRKGYGGSLRAEVSANRSSTHCVMRWQKVQRVGAIIIYQPWQMVSAAWWEGGRYTRAGSQEAGTMEYRWCG